jgi:hypothetical protein
MIFMIFRRSLKPSRRLLMKAAVVALGFCLTLASGCATYEGWSAVKTEHFTLYTAGISNHQDVIRALENGYSGFAASPFFKSSAASVGKIDVLFMDDQDFLDLMGQRRSGAAIAKVPGDGKIGKDGLLVLHPFTLNEMTTDLTLDSDLKATGDADANPGGRAALEMLAHLFIVKAFPKAPLWFHEGFSAYLSTMELRSDDKGQVLSCMGFVRSSDAYLGLSKMWELSFSQVATAEVRGFFRATAYTFIDYILHGDNDAHRGKMGALLGGVASGDDSQSVIKAVFDGTPLDAIDTAVKSHRNNMAAVLTTKTKARSQCPMGVLVPPELKPADVITPISTEANPTDIEAVFRALGALPALDEFPPYFPLEVTAAVRVPPAGS